MNLFERLLPSRLCNEQAHDGGAAPAASEPATPVSDNPASSGEESTPADDNPQPGAEGDKQQEGNPEGEDKPDGKKESDKPEGAPEKYEFQAGEGVELDADALKEFEPVARDLGLTNEQAQKLVDIYPKLLAGMQQRQTEAWQQQTEQWATEVKADKEIGGDKLTASVGVAQRALDTFGSPELKDYLNGTGLGNHPELVKFCVKVGKAMSEDNMVTSGNGGQLSAAEVLYGNK